MSAFNKKTVWWLGPCGHEWEAQILNRANGYSCPYCAGYRPHLGLNDLTTTHPELAVEWHPVLNQNLEAKDFSAGSDYKAWWLGSCGHEWEARIQKRTTGRTCPVCLNRKVVININDLATTHPDIAKEWSPKNVSKNTIQNISAGSNKKIIWMCDENHEWVTAVAHRTLSGTKCPECQNKKTVSKAEHEIATILEKLDLKIEQSNRKILNGQEIDLYVPERKIGIEFNGIYWHNDTWKTQLYHYNKWLASKKVGIQLIQIWEDDWNKRKEIVINSLLHKLNIKTVPVPSERVFARKTVIHEVSTSEARIFLEKNHIQGFASGKYYVALESNNNIHALMVLKAEKNHTFNIIRYATNVNVIGGFSKILKYVELTYPVKRFITFSDHTISDGGLYSKNGFTADKEIRPDYMYVVKGERKHKFGYRIKRFKNDPNLKYAEGLTESQLAQLNNIPRIWDAGKTRWTKTLNSANIK